MTEFENVRPVLEWICQGVTQKNFLTQNELDAYSYIVILYFFLKMIFESKLLIKSNRFEELSVESKGIDVCIFFIFFFS